MRPFYKSMIVAATLLAIGLPGLAVACWDCEVAGHIEAEINQGDPGLGDWEYTLTLTWDTGYYSISYIMLFLDDLDQNCTCEELQTAITFPMPAGMSEAGPSYPDHWHVCDWEGSVVCIDNPCLPHDGIYMRFDDYNCEHPGCCGGGTFVFYSDYMPTDIGMPNLFFKLGSFGDACLGELTGVFPALPCGPTADEQNAWGAIKSMFR